MEVFVDTALGISFSIGVNIWDTVLTMKQKIEKSQCIPVSKQILFFDSKVLDDNFDIVQYQIFHNSRLLLIISPDYSLNQNYGQSPYQTEQSPSEPSDQFQEFVYPQDWPLMDNDQVTQTEQSPSEPSDQCNEFVYPQACPVMVRSNKDQVLHQTEPPLVTTDSVKEFLENQASPEIMEGENNQVLHQNEQFSVPSNSIGETLYGQDQPLRISDISMIQRFESMKTEENIHGQYSPVMGSSMKNEPLLSNSSEEFLGIQDLPSVPVGSSSRNKNQGLKTEQSLMSGSVKRIINTSDLPVNKRRKTNPMKLTVMVQPFQETRKIPVYVNANEKVEELRKVLAKMQQIGELDLPQEGYFFIHKQDVLTDNQTFEENLVSHGDTIEIFRGKVTLGGSVPPRTRTLSH